MRSVGEAAKTILKTRGEENDLILPSADTTIPLPNTNLSGSPGTVDCDCLQKDGYESIQIPAYSKNEIRIIENNPTIAHDNQAKINPDNNNPDGKDDRMDQV
jgi:hypothetical protein